MMKKLFAFACLAAVVVYMHAENKQYTYQTNPSKAYYGSLTRISPNGKWAVGGDTGFTDGGYIINTENPADLQIVADGEFYDVTNGGLCVGAWYELTGTGENQVKTCRAAFYTDGKWYLLDEPAEIIGESYAKAVSPGGRYIAGQAFCYAKDSEAGGKNYPCLWTFNDETGSYDLTCYNTLDLPGNMGFYVNDMSEDGKIMVGFVFAHAGSEVGAILTDGEMKVWHEMDWREEPFYYKGEIQGYYDTAFIDEVIEGADETSWTHEQFGSIKNGYAFGNRDILTNYDPEEKSGVFEAYQTIYDIAADEFNDVKSSGIYSCGFDNENAFLTLDMKAYYMADGKYQPVADFFGIAAAEEPAVIYDFDDKGSVFCGAYIYFNEAIGGYCDMPLLITVDEPLRPDAEVKDEEHVQIASISAVVADANAPVEYFNLQGVKVTNPANGIYVCRRGADVKKVFVK